MSITVDTATNCRLIASWAGRCLQNVSLMAAAEGLATEVRVVNDASALADAMMLRKNQRLLLVQTVALPADG